jgi:O-antigen/teichoic acid export membrane protein
MKRLLDLRHKQFVKDALVLQLASLVQAATYFLTSVLTEHGLGLHELGRWVTARELFTIAYFFVSLGLVTATVSHYAEAVGRQDRARCVNALAALVKVGGCSSLLMLLLGFTLGPWASERWYADRSIGLYAGWLCVSGAFEVVRGLTVAALQGSRQMRAFAWFDMTTNVLRVGIVAAALALGLGVPGLVGAALVHMALASAVSLRFYAVARRGSAKLAPPPLREVLAAVPGASVKHVFDIGLLLALNKSLDTLIPRFGMILIPALGVAAASAEAFSSNGAYSIGHVLSWGLGLAMTGVTQTLLPAVGLKLGADVPFDRLGGYLRRVSLWSGCCMAAATLLSVPVAWLVIHHVYDDAAEAFGFYLLLASGNLFIGFTSVVQPFLIYSGRLRAMIKWNLLLGAAGLCGILAGGRLGGPKGAAAAAGLVKALGLFHLVYIWVYFRRARARAASSPHPGPAP